MGATPLGKIKNKLLQPKKDPCEEYEEWENGKVFGAPWKPEWDEACKNPKPFRGGGYMVGMDDTDFTFGSEPKLGLRSGPVTINPVTWDDEGFREIGFNDK